MASETGSGPFSASQRGGRRSGIEDRGWRIETRCNALTPALSHGTREKEKTRRRGDKERRTGRIEDGS
jgi:hypothetical protein